MSRPFWLTISIVTLALAPLIPAMAQDGTTTVDLSSASGVVWQFQPEGGDARPITVPGGGWRAQGYTCDAGTYRAAIPIPMSAQGHVVQIVFDAVNFGATVSAGVGADTPVVVARHVDGWVPITADVTSVAQPGKSLSLTVEVLGRRKFMVNGKYTVPEGATWDPYLEEGILRGVHLRILPLIHADDVYVVTSVTRKTLQASVTVTNASPKAETVTLTPTLSSVNGTHFAYPKIPPVSLTLAAGETRAVPLGAVPWTLGTRGEWWPNVPYVSGYRAQLHTLDVAVGVGGRMVQRYRQRFGFRQFEAVGNHYELNGIRCNLRGDNQQEADFGTDGYGVRPGFGPPTPGNGGWPVAVDRLERLNFNVMRIHQIPATPYMLDVCDAMGLMLVEESPLRGSEGGEDYADGRDNMLNMDRELVQRDRDHPATVIWSAANEWSEPIREAVPAIQAIDDTRPIIADGIGDLGAPYINMQHYVNGLDALPIQGGTPRADRPYGETEDVWFGDNTRRGFAWMATGIRLRRLLGDADLRNYVLNNAWSNYVPGEDPSNEILELKVKGSADATILPPLADAWHDPNILLMQKCYNPVAVCDVQFDRLNANSDDRGDWPVLRPRLEAGTRITRPLAVFNDEFSGAKVRVEWELHAGTTTGPLAASGSASLTIPLGEFRTVDMTFSAPKTPQNLFLALTSRKGERVCFRDDLVGYQIVTPGTPLLPDGDYRLQSSNSGLFAAPGSVGGPAVVQATADGQNDQLWHVTNVGHDDITLTDMGTSQCLDVEGPNDGDNAVLRPASGADTQKWHLDQLNAEEYTLTNVGTGKNLDVYAASTTPGSRVAQWHPTGGKNQAWRFTGK